MITTLQKEISESKSLDSLRLAMLKLAKNLSCDYIFYNIQISNSVEENLFLGIGNYPPSWLKKYIEKDYAQIDPILIHCLNQTDLIYWKQHNNSSANQQIKDFFYDAKQFGLNDGVSKGLHKSQSEIGIISLASMNPLNHNHIASVIDIFQPLIHESIIRLDSSYKDAKLKILTKRELEALHHMAEGKTSIDIAYEMKISENTVVFHIKNIIKKLNATNRTQAVARAIMIGLISHTSYYDEKINAYKLI